MLNGACCRLIFTIRTFYKLSVYRIAILPARRGFEIPDVNNALVMYQGVQLAQL